VRLQVGRSRGRAAGAGGRGRTSAHLVGGGSLTDEAQGEGEVGEEDEGASGGEPGHDAGESAVGNDHVDDEEGEQDKERHEREREALLGAQERGRASLLAGCRGRRVGGEELLDAEVDLLVDVAVQLGEELGREGAVAERCGGGPGIVVG